MSWLEKVKQDLHAELISMKMYPKTYITVAAALGMIVAMFIVALW